MRRSAARRSLIGAGHHVIGLARSDAGEKQLTAAGAAVQRGSLEDLESLKRGAAEAEGVIHLAFIHEFTDFAASCAKDATAIEALGGVLAGSNRPLVVSSGVLGLAQGRAATEEDVPGHGYPRRSKEMALSFAPKGVRASVIRLSPSVHGDGDHGFVPQLTNSARTNGFAAYVGDGKNRWPGVHQLDAARLYRLALEKGTAGGRYYGVADEGVPIRDIAEIIGKRVGVPAVSKSAEEVVSALGFIGHVLAMDALSSSKRTQERLGWRPTQPGLMADLEKGTYFDAK